MDLHGLEVVEALGFVKSRLAADAAAGRPSLVLIYGAGHHSAAGQKIKPAVMALLAERQLSVIEGATVPLCLDRSDTRCQTGTGTRAPPARPTRAAAR